MKPMGVSLGARLAEKLQLEIRSRHNDVTEVAVVDKATGKTLNPKLGAAMLHDMGIKGAVENTTTTSVVTDADMRRAAVDAAHRSLVEIADVIRRVPCDWPPLIYVVGDRLVVKLARQVAELDLDAARAYLGRIRKNRRFVYPWDDA